MLSGIPAYLRRTPAAPLRKKRSKRQGKRGGVLVKLKILLTSSRPTDHRLLRDGRCRPTPDVRRLVRWLRPVVPAVTGLLSPEPAVAPGSTPLLLLPMDPAAPQGLTPPGPVSWHSPTRRCRRGVDHSSLRMLKRVVRVPPASEELNLRMALINVRSLANKTFQLNYFFTTRELDFMFLTETWLTVGDNVPFSELLPPDCDFLNSPRTTGNGVPST
ncbi:hypothetical protein AAFF_G00316850 [Aldrovandia affinis]|uniref:Uncharacterized protein n=1 Tax=Aldrovandia affinis TaxID=143900 RepID=A0AAD7WQW0_9TELE|nr:hypothetical protein AAFF_G00316850 [Aldrovandia affinis]